MGSVLGSCCGDPKLAEEEAKDEQVVPTINVYGPSDQKKMKKEQRILSYKDYKGFKKVSDDFIKDRYLVEKQIGNGSFGKVFKALHKKADVICAIKQIKKTSIEQHEILVNLMHNELKVLEETVKFILLSSF